MSPLLIGYARATRSGSDGGDQRNALLARGVPPDQVYIDTGLTGMTRPRPALGEALAACRADDTLVVTQLSRLARSVPDAHQLISQLSARQVTLAVGDDRYPPHQPAGQVLLQVLALTQDLQAAVTSAGTREGLTAARARGNLRGRPPKLSPLQERHLVDLYAKAEHTVGEVGELLNVSRSTVYRAVRRAGAQATDL